MASNETWQVILEAASQTFTERGYKGASLGEITSRIKKTKGALYHYVSSKEDLWLKCHMYMLEKAVSKVRPLYESSLPPDLKLYQMIKAHVQNVIGNTNYYLNYSFIEKNCIPPSIPLHNLTRQRDEFEEMFASVIKEGIVKKYFKPVDVKFAKLSLMGAMNYITNWYTTDGELSSHGISEKIAEFITTCLLSTPAKKNDGLLDLLEKERVYQAVSNSGN